jgi:hypothetical protein
LARCDGKIRLEGRRGETVTNGCEPRRATARVGEASWSGAVRLRGARTLGVAGEVPMRESLWVWRHECRIPRVGWRLVMINARESGKWARFGGKRR